MKSRIKAAAAPRVGNLLHSELPRLAPSLMQVAQFWPHEYESDSFARPTGQPGTTTHPSTDLPVPPREFWASYCTSVESYLDSGREDCETMRRLLDESGKPIERATAILELGCAGGRMLRWLADLAPDTELWGADIWSSAVLWCQDHLSPPCNFLTNTMVPHLPFEDRSLDLVFCGSVFTHVDDLAEAWFLELRRVLRPDGRLYFSVNDRHAVRVFDGLADPDAYPRYHERAGGRENWDHFVGWITEQRDYQRFRNSDAYMVTIGRSMNANVLWDSEELCRRLAYGYRVCSVTPESYGHQTSVLLERV